MKPVPVSVPDLSQSVQPDDYIEIKLVGGTTIALTVTEVTTESIAGYQKGEENPSRYAKDQMVEINKFPKDGSKTTKSLSVNSILPIRAAGNAAPERVDGGETKRIVGSLG